MCFLDVSEGPLSKCAIKNFDRENRENSKTAKFREQTFSENVFSRRFGRSPIQMCNKKFCPRKPRNFANKLFPKMCFLDVSEGPLSKCAIKNFDSENAKTAKFREQTFSYNELSRLFRSSSIQLSNKKF